MNKHKLIGTYQLITGIFGILWILLNIGKAFHHREAFFTVFVGIALFSGLSFLGYALIKELKYSVKYSIVMQAIQSIAVIYQGKQYLFSAGSFYSLIYNTPSSFRTNFQMIPLEFNISEVSATIPFELRIYILPLILLLILAIRK